MAIGQSELDLSWMISPMDCSSFVGSYWTQGPLRISRSDRLYYRQLLSERELEYALFVASKSPGSVEELGDKQRPRQVRNHAMAVESFRGGRSLRIDGIQRFSRKLILLCRALEQEFSCPTNINLYLTPGQAGARALDRHYDTHDVFILQTHGRKKWRIYDSPIEFPLEYLPPIRCERQGRFRQKIEVRKELAARSTANVVNEFILEAGDLLYLPRGYWHEAEGVAGHVSCHLTVGIQALTYMDLMTIAITQAATRNPKLRESLPVGFGTYSDCRGAVREQVAQIVESLRPQIDSDSALAEVAEIFVRSRQSLDGALLRSPAALNVEGVGLGSRVRIRDGVICRVSVSESNVSLNFGAAVFSLPLAFESACRFIARTRRFTPSELPGDVTNDERVSMVQRLIKDGLLTSADAQTMKAIGPTEKIRGWVPTKLNLRLRRSTIEWLYLGREPLADPFFHQTITRVKATVPDVPMRETGLKALSRLEDEVLPSGFIFHVSRCGSTLLANGLRAIPETIVVSEAQPFGALFVPRKHESGVSNGWETKRDELLRGIVRAYGQRRAGNEKALVIKFSSWDILSFQVVRRLWPEVPCVVVVRDPIEVMVSCIQEPPGWMRLKRDAAVASRVFGWTESSIDEMTDEQFCARGIAEFFRAGAANLRGQCRVVSYENLKAPRVRDIARFFGLDVAQLGEQKLDEVFATYAKDSKGMKPFVDDREEKQNAATDVIRGECKQWAEEPYLLLKQQESW